jgi:hypothetical protein
MLPDPQSSVFTINETSYTEPDNYEAAGINYLVAMMAACQNRNCMSIARCGGAANISTGEDDGSVWFLISDF